MHKAPHKKAPRKKSPSPRLLPVEQHLGGGDVFPDYRCLSLHWPALYRWACAELASAASPAPAGPTRGAGTGFRARRGPAGDFPYGAHSEGGRRIAQRDPPGHLEARPGADPGSLRPADPQMTKHPERVTGVRPRLVAVGIAPRTEHQVQAVPDGLRAEAQVHDGRVCGGVVWVPFRVRRKR
jgi:hypothetical protein